MAFEPRERTVYWTFSSRILHYDLNSLQRESVSTGKRKQEREDRTVGWGENPIGFGSFFYTWYLA
jgi:hypothetical protein